ncbi:hypothetical protein HEPPS_00160 [Candidatus Hepatoplasma crinochetorum]|uniref:Uncharacterized protein n=1 Tax=Candidatus Hepatoplasma crinochetorum TaxID=295596 RepID=A0A0G7ZKY9_9MOLU|nr:hypothetical protein HEPPS_00160 [Candidatus Hepatoplasma crinochetorum]
MEKYYGFIIIPLLGIISMNSKIKSKNKKNKS